MSAALNEANVVDFASYRQQRKQEAAADRANAASLESAMLPVMIPVVTWIPIWQLAPFMRPGDSINE